MRWLACVVSDSPSGTSQSSSAGASASSSADPTRTQDRLWKVRPIISAVVAARRTNYRPHREQAVDEAMVAFKGRSSMKQYLLMKPVKRAFKVWVQSDSHNGYVCELECYTGRKGDKTEVGLGDSVVTRLTRDVVGKSYHLFMDSFFISVIVSPVIVFIVRVQYVLTDATSLLTSRMQQSVAEPKEVI